MKDTLTKENFWDEMEQKYPKAMAHFKEWVDVYKKENEWSTLFMCEFEGDRGPEYLPKYHELPIAMQFGIFLEYWNDWCNNQTPCKILIPGNDDRLQSYNYYQGIRAYIISALYFMEGAPI